MKYLTLPDGKKYEWKEIRRLRREQIREARIRRQPTLFPVRDDVRPATQATVAGRYENPTLFND